MPWQTVQENGGEWLRKWYRTRLANLSRLSGEPPKSLCIDELSLTVCCRYAETLLKNTQIKRYLMKYHPKELHELAALLAEFNRLCGLPR
jgi:hypothetical protein